MLKALPTASARYCLCLVNVIGTKINVRNRSVKPHLHVALILRANCTALLSVLPKCFTFGKCNLRRNNLNY